MHPSISNDEADEFLILQIAALARRRAREVLSADLADDLAQDIVLECLIKLREGLSFDRESLGGFIRHMVRRRAIDAHRRIVYREKRNASHANEIALSVREWMDPELVLELKELEALRANALNELPLGCREAFHLVREEELPYSTVAEKLGVSHASVCRHVVMAQRTLRTQLLANGIAAPPPNASRARSIASARKVGR